MRIYIEQISDRGFSSDFEEKADRFTVLEALSKSGECVFITTLKIGLELKLFRKLMVEAKGRIRTGIRIECSRCLSEFETDIISEFRLVYAVPSQGLAKFKEKNELELSTEDVGLMYYNGEFIDTDDMVQEQTIMSIPYKPLCKESCKGLCPKCGSDLNHEVCLCDGVTVDPRLSILKTLQISDKKD